MPQVIQNLVSLSRVAPGLGFKGAPLVPVNTGKDRVTAWETVVAGGPLKVGHVIVYVITCMLYVYVISACWLTHVLMLQHVDDLLAAGSPAERITQLVVELGETKHQLDAAKSDNHGLQATMRELKDKHRQEKDTWMGEKLSLENRLKKFEPIDTVSNDGAPDACCASLSLSLFLFLTALRVHICRAKKASPDRWR